MWEKAVWLGVPDEEIKKKNILQNDMNGRFSYYRCEMELKEKAFLKIAITANTRYRLWVNGEPVLSGPCKGDRHRHFYEMVDLSDRLRIGKNIFAVQVLLCDANSVSSLWDERAPLFAVDSLPKGHRLAVAGTFFNENGEVLGELTTGRAPWKEYLDDSFYLTTEESTDLLGAVLLGAIKEKIDFRKSPSDWKNSEFCIANWMEPKVIADVEQSFINKRVGFYQDYPLREREIPLLYEKEQSFSKMPEEFAVGGIMRIPAHTRTEFVLDAGVHTNAQIQYFFEKGYGATISFVYSERYFSPTKQEIKRTDKENGILVGFTDKIILNGEKLRFEPFWYRTFRFIKITIQADEEDVLMYYPKIRRTGYPLQIESEIRSDAPWFEKLWNMCIRTLQNCMMETYMDCPYFEQMQYVMDTRLQALFTYALSTDTRLVKKALEDFHDSMMPVGVLQGRSNDAFLQIIPTFSLYYIFILEDYYRQTKDVETVKRYRSDVDTILEYYDRKIGNSGLVENLGYWAFIDWVPEWDDSAGVPDAVKKGPSVIHNLMYAYALQSGAYIYEMTGRKALSGEYKERRQSILCAVQETCWDEEKGLYREGPQVQQYTQHAQAWAILNEMVSKEEAQRILKRAMNEEEVLPCTFSTSYELFRAFEWAGNYEDTKKFIDKWIGLIDMDCTTCPETPVNARSECHAWSVLPLFEMIRTVAGIRMGEEGWESVVVKPHMSYLNHLEGKAVTPKGMIEFCFDKEKNCYEVTLPDSMRGIFIGENGERTELSEGKNSI